MTADTVILMACILIPPLLAALYLVVLNDEWRASRAAVWCACGLFPLLLVGLDGLLLFRFGAGASAKLLLAAVNTPLSFLAYLSVTNYTVGRASFIYFTSAAFNLASSVLASVLGFSETEETAERLAVKIAINLLGLLLLRLYFAKPFRCMLREIDSGWRRLTSIPVAFCILLMLVHIPPWFAHRTTMRVISLLLCIALFSIYFSLHHLFRLLQAKYQLEYHNDLLRAQVNDLQSYAGMVLHMNNELRVFRHDMRHYFQLQSACFQSGDPEGARRVLRYMDRHLEESWSNQQLCLYTPSPIINAAVSYYAGLSKQRDIDFSIRLNLPDPPPADPTELAVLLSNVLENAVHACTAIPAGEPRVIRLSGEQKHSQFFLEAENTYTGEPEFDRETGLPVSRAEGHGLGVQSISGFAEKHHALIDFQADGGWFRLRLLF